MSRMTTRFAPARPAAVAGVSTVVVVFALACSSSARAADARPDAPPADAASTAPGADQIQFAAREHDLGYRAYLDKQYDEAASHFENAFFAAPNPAELRSAIRARKDAGELARAATLAAIGQRRFPTDAATSKVATDTVALARAHVYEVDLVSSAEYSAAIDAKIVSAERVKESRLFMNPGAHELLVSWSDGRNVSVSINATEGGSETLHLDPPVPPTPAPVPPAPAPEPPPVPGPAPQALPQEPTASPAATKPFGPAVFITGAALTGVGLGVTVWSGINTLNSPGKDAVRVACVGQTQACPTYQTGLAHQTRTNVLIGVTSGLAVVTALVGVFFTQWSPAHAAVGLHLEPWLGSRQVGVEGSF
jgi:hypothetical protein